MNEEFFISLVGEVFDGYTESNFEGSTVYLKHFSVKDQRYLNVFYEKYKENAISKGLPKEDEILKDLKKDDLWSDEDDLNIQNLETEIENLKSTKKGTFLKSGQTKIQETIDEKSESYYNLLTKRKELVGKTAEDYATSMSAVEMIRYFVFKDKELTVHAFSEDEFDSMSDINLLVLRKMQNEINERLSEENIQKAALRPFFSMYLSYCENPSDFYGKPLIYLSVFQIKLILFGRIFQSIFQYTEDIPDNIRDDPEKLLAYSESKSNAAKGKKGKPFINENAAGSTVFGGTKEDVEDLSDVNTVSLSDEIKKAGGKLDMEQMMKLAGQ